MAAALVAGYSDVSAQKTEHYNSPLYSPKTTIRPCAESTGLPEALKTVGIEQKLGASLPLDTEFKDEDGNAVKLGAISTRAGR